MMKIIKQGLFLLTIFSFYFATTAFSGDINGLKVGFVYFTSISDGGWTHSHNQARKKLEITSGVTTSYIENVRGPSYVESALKYMAENGFKLIFSTTYEYMDPTIKVAEKYPNVIFMHCSGHKRAPNVGTYFGRMYQARYLSGIVAGEMSKSGQIGYIGAFKIPEIIRGLNAFTLGVRSVNPKAKVYLIFVEDWSDPARSVEAANHLIDAGIDALAQHQDSPAGHLIAEKRGIYSIGYHSNISNYTPNSHLVSAIWKWEVFYQSVVKEVQQGLWKSKNTWWGLKEGVVDISEFGNIVPQKAQDKVLRVKKEIKEGAFSIFEGPIKSHNKKKFIPKGTSLSDKEILNMDWYVEGVVEVQ